MKHEIHNQWIKKSVLPLALCICALTVPMSHSAHAQEETMDESMYTMPVTTIDGEATTLEKYRGFVMLIVNTASRCGYTKQYAGLQTLNERFYDKGLRILGFPSNDFMGQEPGTEKEIKEFCSLTYNVTFDMFSKIKVTGSGQDPLFAYLTTCPGFEGKVTWNFNKFLVDRNGTLVTRWGSQTDPLSDTVVSEITALLETTNA